MGIKQLWLASRCLDFATTTLTVVSRSLNTFRMAKFDHTFK